MSVAARPRGHVASECWAPLGAEQLESRILLTTVIGVDPAANSVDAPLATAVSATFDQNVTAATPQTFVVHGSLSRGALTGPATSVTVAGAVGSHQPTNAFVPGELVRATITAGVSTAGGAAVPRVWQFRTAPASGSGEFADTGQVVGFGNRPPAPRFTHAPASENRDPIFKYVAKG